MEFVYFIRAGVYGHIKIGRTTDVNQRLKTLQTGNPERLDLLACYETKPWIDENILRKRFAESNFRNEWYTADEELLALIDALKEDNQKVAKQILQKCPITSATNRIESIKSTASGLLKSIVELADEMECINKKKGG